MIDEPIELIAWAGAFAVAVIILAIAASLAVLLVNAARAAGHRDRVEHDKQDGDMDSFENDVSPENRPRGHR